MKSNIIDYVHKINIHDTMGMRDVFIIKHDGITVSMTKNDLCDCKCEDICKCTSIEHIHRVILDDNIKTDVYMIKLNGINYLTTSSESNCESILSWIMGYVVDGLLNINEDKK